MSSDTGRRGSGQSSLHSCYQTQVTHQRQTWVGQTKDTISLHVLHERGLSLAQTKDLICHSQTSNLPTKDEASTV